MRQGHDMGGARARAARIRREHDLEATTLDAMERRLAAGERRARRSFLQRLVPLVRARGSARERATETDVPLAEPS